MAREWKLTHQKYALDILNALQQFDDPAHLDYFLDLARRNGVSEAEINACLGLAELVG